MIKSELVAVCLYRPYWQLDTLPHTIIMNSCFYSPTNYDQFMKSFEHYGDGNRIFIKISY